MQTICHSSELVYMQLICSNFVPVNCIVFILYIYASDSKYIIIIFSWTSCLLDHQGWTYRLWCPSDLLLSILNLRKFINYTFHHVSTEDDSGSYQTGWQKGPRRGAILTSHQTIFCRSESSKYQLVCFFLYRYGLSFVILCCSFMFCVFVMFFIILCYSMLLCVESSVSNYF